MVFRPQDIRDRLREQPFTPFRVVTCRGESHDIRNPDLVMVGATFLMVGTPSRRNPDFSDSVTRLALADVTEVRDLPPWPL